MPKTNITIDGQEFKLTRNGDLAIAQRNRSSEPIPESLLKPIAFKAEQVEQRRVHRIRASNGSVDQIIVRPGPGWNEGKDWSYLLDAPKTRGNASANGSHRFEDEQPARTGTPPRFQHPARTVPRPQASARSNQTPPDVRRVYVMRPLPRVSA